MARFREQLFGMLVILWTVTVLYWVSNISIEDPSLAAVMEPTLAPTEERIVQNIPPPKVRFTAEQEMELACAEVDCHKKCVAQYGEKKDKVDACKKQCAKERCKERCKHEPTLSYVERELKLEKCLDKCPQGSEKCKRNCEEENKRCKDRCKERAQKYFCVRDLDLLGQDDDEEEVDPAKLAAETDLI